MHKRKVTYPVARTANRPARIMGDPSYVRPTVVTIDTSAMAPRGSFAAGDRVVIASDGLYAGETAIVERLAQGVIPAAVVRTEAGRTRRVRVIDLRPASAQAPTES